MSVRLRGGYTTIDPRLDRIPQFDEQSRSFPIRAVMAPVIPRTPRLWAPPTQVLDQGSEGACVGFGWAAELAASPHRKVAMDNSSALTLYHRAQMMDEWPGESYSGTSVLAGAKACAEDGLVAEYRWAFGIDDVVDALVTHGPVVLGIPWYDSMYETRLSGLVDVSGRVVGGHCIMAYGYHPRMRIRGEGWFTRHEVILWQNSWGASYGRNGRGYVRVEDLDRLLRESGEACIPTETRTRRI